MRDSVHLGNLKNIKNTHGGVLLSVACNFTQKKKFSVSVFHVFLNCTNGTKSRKAYIQKICVTLLETWTLWEEGQRVKII